VPELSALSTAETEFQQGKFEYHPAGFRFARNGSGQFGSASLTILRTTVANCLGSDPLLYGMP
jgi:hypothetical protein